MQPELELGDDAEVAATAPDPPEEIFVLPLAVTTRPSATTTSAVMRLSQVRPYLEKVQP
jgi:hypothetical protein